MPKNLVQETRKVLLLKFDAVYASSCTGNFHNTIVGLDWVEFNAPPDPVYVISEAVFTANHLTVTDKQTIRKKLNINHKNKHINIIRIKENKQLNTHQKQNYPDSVASDDTQPGNEVGLFYNGPEHHTGPQHHGRQ